MRLHSDMASRAHRCASRGLARGSSSPSRRRSPGQETRRRYWGSCLETPAHPPRRWLPQTRRLPCASELGCQESHGGGSSVGMSSAASARQTISGIPMTDRMPGATRSNAGISNGYVVRAGTPSAFAYDWQVEAARGASGPSGRRHRSNKKNKMGWHTAASDFQTGCAKRCGRYTISTDWAMLQHSSRHLCYVQSMFQLRS